MTNDELGEQPDPMGWTVLRLLAMQGQPSEADKLAAVIVKPPARWLPPWSLSGARASQGGRLE